MNPFNTPFVTTGFPRQPGEARRVALSRARAYALEMTAITGGRVYLRGYGFRGYTVVWPETEAQSSRHLRAARGRLRQHRAVPAAAAAGGNLDPCRRRVLDAWGMKS